MHKYDDLLLGWAVDSCSFVARSVIEPCSTPPSQRSQKECSQRAANTTTGSKISLIGTDSALFSVNDESTDAAAERSQFQMESTDESTAAAAESTDESIAAAAGSTDESTAVRKVLPLTPHTHSSALCSAVPTQCPYAMHTQVSRATLE